MQGKVLLADDQGKYKLDILQTQMNISLFLSYELSWAVIKDPEYVFTKLLRH